MHQEDPRIVVFTFMPQKWRECPSHRNYPSSLSALTSGSQITCIWAFFQRAAPLGCKSCLPHLQLSSQPRWENDGTIREMGHPVALQLVSVAGCWKAQNGKAWRTVYQVRSRDNLFILLRRRCGPKNSLQLDQTTCDSSLCLEENSWLSARINMQG